MARHVIFLIHGMGSPTDDTFSSWKTVLGNCYKLYTRNGESIDDKFEFIDIRYNHIFEDLRTQWNDAIDQILSVTSSQNLDLPDEDTLKALTNDNFWGTHIMDILLYRFIPQVREAVRAEVIRQFSPIATGNLGTKYSVIAYSLGSAVAHDAIHAMYHSHPTSPNGQLDPNDFHFDTIAMIANTSRLLQTDVKAYSSIVRPEKKSNGWTSACRSMLTASHTWDPLVTPKLFRPNADWPDPDTLADGRFSYVRPSLIQAWNVHAAEHYLADPTVHIPLFRFLRYKTWISKAKEQAIKKQFSESTPIEKFKTLEARVKPLLGGERDFSWREFFEIAGEFYAIIEDLTNQ